MARNLLLSQDLRKFKQFCVSEGYEILEKTNPYEVLRMRKTGVKGVLVVYCRSSGDYWLTTEGVAHKLAEKFYKHTLGHIPATP